MHLNYHERLNDKTTGVREFLFDKCYFKCENANKIKESLDRLMFLSYLAGYDFKWSKVIGGKQVYIQIKNKKIETAILTFDLNKDKHIYRMNMFLYRYHKPFKTILTFKTILINKRNSKQVIDMIKFFEKTI